MKVLDYKLVRTRFLSFFLVPAIMIPVFISCVKDDKVAPVIVLSGPDIIYLNLNDTWQDPGFTAHDNVDGDLTAKVVVGDNVDTKFVNQYDLTYTVYDKSGNEAVMKLQVFVKADSLKGSYQVNAVVEGVNQGNYTYKVNASPGLEYNILTISNFANLGNNVSVYGRITGATMVIPDQILVNVTPGYEGSVTGMGYYDGLNKKLTQMEYFITYQATGMDHGTCTFIKD